MRSDFIESIINQRIPRAEKVNQVRDKVSQVLNKFEEFTRLCRKSQHENSVLDLGSDSGEFTELFRLVENSETIINEGGRLLTDIHNMASRLSRRTLNIAVIGRARQGKSRLLQTITGLSSYEIPDSNLSFCTGVRSDIINDVTADKTYAVVNFLTEKRFINEVVLPYFDDLNNRYKANLLVPSSVAEFKVFQIPEPGTLRAASGDITQVNLHLEHLRELQRHLSQYQDYLDKPPQKITRERIREYVAQDNEKGERVFFKHVAVDRVEIFCKFPNTDVKALRLIDLPGLGDTRIGDVERVISALSDQVDLVFFLSKPSNSGTGWQDNEIQLYSQARKALGEKLPIERWSFWVFNHDSRPGAENRQQCEFMQRYMSDMQIKVSDSIIVDCTSVEEVSGNLIDKALEFLANNIEHNDSEFAANLQELLNKLLLDIRDITERSERLLYNNSNSDKDSGKFDDLWDDLWKVLPEEIQLVVGENSELRQKRDNECVPFKKRIEEILIEEEESDMSARFDLYIKRAANRRGGLMTAYEEAMHRLRTGLSRRMQEDLDSIINSVLTDMKDQIGDILADTGNLEKVFGVRAHKLLDEVVAYMENSLGKDEVPTLFEGFSLLAGWTMNYRSFIQHRLRSSLNKLDPLDPASREYGNPSDAEETVTMLAALYNETIAEIRKAFADIYSEPNKAAFAIAEEFKDIVIRSSESEGRGLENQWRRFYRSIRGKVWPEEYGNSQRRQELCIKLRAPLNDIAMLLNSFDARL